jgi:enoyl-CoA hydratase
VDEAVAVAARAASGPKELAGEIKRTLAKMAGVTDRDDAVETELGPQLWSTRQPWFAERLAALRSRVSRRS